MMESEKSELSEVAVRFRDAVEAARLVAGVPAAARIARALAEQGYISVWLVLPSGVAPDPLLAAEVRRFAGAAQVHWTDMAGLAEKLDRPDHAEIPVIHAPRLDAAEVLKGTGKASDGPVSRWLNRPVSRRISALLLLIPGIRPVHATAGTALIAAVMFAALVAGGAPGLLVGGLLFHAASVFDGVDGEIARATGRSSPAGATLDTMVDIATNLLFVFGVTLNLSLRGYPQAPGVGAWGFALFTIGLLLLSWHGLRSGGPFNLDLLKRRYGDRRPGRAGALVARFGTVVTSRDFFALLFALLIVVRLPMAVLYVFASAATVWILFVIAAVFDLSKLPLARRSA